jgi:hypothetical protein
VTMAVNVGVPVQCENLGQTLASEEGMQIVILIFAFVKMNQITVQYLGTN